MYQRIYYSNSGIPWSKEEAAQLEDRYVNQRLTISEIGDLHKRTPGGIGYQLKRMNIIETNEEARGYEDYRASALYKEIVSKTIENKKNKAKEHDYTRVGEVWDQTESAQLIDEYVKRELSLLEISKIHNRTPTGIAAQLRHLDIVKTRKMTKRFRNLSLPQKKDKFQYIIKGLKSNDFSNIEKIWKVHIPLNKKDLEDYIV